jgi:hypothetical protein
LDVDMSQYLLCSQQSLPLSPCTDSSSYGGSEKNTEVFAGYNERWAKIPLFLFSQAECIFRR